VAEGKIGHNVGIAFYLRLLTTARRDAIERRHIYRPTPCPEKEAKSLLCITLTNVESQFRNFAMNHPDDSFY